MNSFKIVIISFKRNVKTYSMYLMAMVFSVATYYNFVSMRHNPQFLKYKEVLAYIENTSMAASMLMILFFIFFILYSGNFFMNQRKKELGVYVFMGVDNYKIAFIFASEGLLLGLLSLGGGLAFGILFSKLFLMMLAKTALLNMRIDFFICKDAIIETTGVYILILSLSFLKGYLSIIRTNLIDLMNSLKREEELPKINYPKGIVSLIIIGAAYYVAVNYDNIGFGTSIIGAVILVILGTYWLFGSFLPIIIRYLIKRKNYLYKGTNIISISNMAFRIKDNYRTLAAIAVLITTSITAFGTSGSLKYYVEENYKVEVPYTISYISHNIDEIKMVEKAIEDFNHTIKMKNNVSFLYAPEPEVVVISLSAFKKVSSDLDVRSGDKIASLLTNPEDEGIYIENPRVIMSLRTKETILLGSKAYKIKGQVKTPLFGVSVSLPCIVVADEEYEVLRGNCEERQFNGIILDREEDIKDLTIELAKVMSPESSLYTRFIIGVRKYDIMGILYFLGLFLFLVFVFATGSIIYFKILSESFKDKGKYEILKKLGITDFEIRESITKQVGLFFVLPLLVGVIHSIVAILVLSDLIKYSLIEPTVISIGILIIIYSIFYILTRKKYIKIVES